MSNINKTKISKKVNRFFYRIREHLSLPETKFLKDIVVGVIKTGDIHLSRIARSLKEPIKYLYTEKRLRRNIGREGFWKRVIIGFLISKRRLIEGMKYVVVDDSDIQKRYAKRMEYLSKVRDGSTGKIGRGYHLLNMIAVSEKRENFLDVYSELYSFQEYIGSANSKFLEALDLVFSIINKMGKILVLDRGFDAKMIIKPLLGKSYNFIIRLERQRNLILEGKEVGYEQWEKIPLTHKTVLERIKKNGKKKLIHYRAGIKKVSLPYKGYRDKNLWLLVMKKTGPGISKDEGYSYFLGNLEEKTGKEEALRELVAAYSARWRHENFTVR